MKSLAALLLLSWLLSTAHAQQPYLFTLADLEQLANCPNHACFKKVVQAKGYAFGNTEKLVTDGVPLTTHTYYVLSTGAQPYHREHLITYAEQGNVVSVYFLTKSATFPGQLDADLEQAGYTRQGSANPDQDREYSKETGGRLWTLYRSKPGLAAGTATYTVGLSGTPAPAGSAPKTEFPVGAPVKPAAVATAPTSTGELPHLGGDWDTKYPPANAADLFRAERQYAATHDREHGKTGHTFFRVEKVRIQGKRLGQYRPLTDKRWADAFDLALRRTGFEAFADNRQQLYRQEALFDLNGERIWVPIQESIIKTLEKESKVNESITLYAVLVSYHDFSGTLHLSFLVNEFAAPATTDLFDPKRKPESGQPVQAINPANQPAGSDKTQPETGTAKPVALSGIRKTAPGSCGFNWVLWQAVPAAEKAMMKTVMVTEYKSPTVSLPQYIAAEMAQGNTIQVARHDFFNDGQAGYVVYVDYKIRQNGDKGRVDVFENLGESKLWPSARVQENLCAVQPFNDGKTNQQRRRGVVGDDGQLTEFLGNIFFEREYALFLTKAKQKTPPSGAGNGSVPAAAPKPTAQSTGRVGAKTPEDLAMLLLKCLKTNDKATWMRCTHPDDEVETDEVSARRFEQHREQMTAQGVTNWSLVQFSRLTYPLRPMGGSKVDPNQTIPHASLEVTYKNQEFIGRISIGTFSFYEGRWLLWFCGYPSDDQIGRNSGR